MKYNIALTFLVAVAMVIYATVAADDISFIDQHPSDVIATQNWIIGVLGTTVIGLFMFTVKGIFTRFNRIEDQAKLINANLSHIRDDLKEDISLIKREIGALDHRVTQIETSCNIYHGYDRRKHNQLNPRGGT